MNKCLIGRINIKKEVYYTSVDIDDSEWASLVLQSCFNTKHKVKNLINKGDIESIGEGIQATKFKKYTHKRKALNEGKFLTDNFIQANGANTAFLFKSGKWHIKIPNNDMIDLNNC